MIGSNLPTLLEHSYEPRGACNQLFAERGPEVLVAGPAGTGKSRACLEKLNALCMKYPGIRALIVRKTFTSLATTALDTWKKAVITENLERKVVEYYGGSGQEPAQYRYSNGSVVVIGGMDKSSRIMSSEFDVIYVQEATELGEGDWEALTTRLRNNKMPYQQLIADCNPDKPTHWLKVRCNNKRTLMLNSAHEDNPTLFNHGRITPYGAEYIAKLDALTGMRKLRLRYGKWVSAEGVVYEQFDEKTHVIDNFKIPDDWARYWTVDFGYTNAFVCQFWAVDGDGKLYLYREIYKTGRTVDQHADSIKKLVMKFGNWVEKKPAAIITDHDPGQRTQLSKALNMTTTLAKKTKNEGIQAVQKRLRDNRLFFFRDARVDRDEELAEAKKPTSTIEEIEGYVWDNRNGLKEEPLKIDDHGMDAMRYMVAQLDLKARIRARWI